MNHAAAHIKSWFPKLRAEHSFKITSPQDGHYNCIAWAAGDTTKWWWPSPFAFWPISAHANMLTAFEEAFGELGFTDCESMEHESGFEKVAIFVSRDGRPTHAARMLPNGKWTSKLGRAEDIEHDLEDIEGEVYGHVACAMKRPSRRVGE